MGRLRHQRQDLHEPGLRRRLNCEFVSNAVWAEPRPIIINKLAPGAHKVLLKLVDPTHKLITGETVSFEVPKPAAALAH